MHHLLFSLSLLVSAAIPPTIALAAPPTDEKPAYQGYVLFDVNSAGIRQVDRPLLKRIAREMAANPKISLLLVGHTDSSGNPTYNRRLSQRRGQAVANLMAQLGVGVYRISQRAAEPTPSPVTTACEDDQQWKRRVDLAFYPRHLPAPSTALVSAPAARSPWDQASGGCAGPPPTAAGATSSPNASRTGKPRPDGSGWNNPDTASRSTSQSSGRSGYRHGQQERRSYPGYGAPRDTVPTDEAGEF